MCLSAKQLFCIFFAQPQRPFFFSPFSLCAAIFSVLSFASVSLRKPPTRVVPRKLAKKWRPNEQSLGALSLDLPWTPREPGLGRILSPFRCCFFSPTPARQPEQGFTYDEHREFFFANFFEFSRGAGRPFLFHDFFSIRYIARTTRSTIWFPLLIVFSDSTIYRRAPLSLPASSPFSQCRSIPLPY